MPIKRISAILLAACVAWSIPAFAADAVFSPVPAESAHPGGTAQAATISPAPATWFDTAFALLTSNQALAVVAFVALRLLTNLQAKTQLDLGKAVGAAHSLFNTLWDMGLIKNGSFRAAEEAFFSNFDTQYFNAYGHKPDGAAEDNAHAEFSKLFTAHTGDDVPAAPAPKVA